jgi:hypothetical protein
VLQAECVSNRRGGANSPFRSRLRQLEAPSLGLSLLRQRCLRLGQLCAKHQQNDEQPAQDSEGPKSTHQGEGGHDPPLPPRKALVPRLSPPALNRMLRSRLPACASGHERPDDESERSWEGLAQVDEGLPQCR